MIESIQALDSISSISNISNSISSQQATSEIDFASLIETIDNKLEVSETNFNALASGENIETHDVIMALEEAKMSLSLMVEVRNKIVEAYQEVSRMQV
ncbi:MAG: flagellar hook-basal body complex protein FliE [Gammaproteobacteria bacterium]|nr:flagellar hook-basal body complex protein FliE [Gammaproteobacteria bacterium]